MNTYSAACHHPPEKRSVQRAEVCHINTPLQPEERAAIEILAMQENRSRGQQIRHLATLKLREMGLLPALPVPSPKLGREKA